MRPLVMAERCRGAAFELVNARGWNKRELAQWLVGVYRPLALSLRDDGLDSMPPSSRSSFPPSDIEALLVRTQREVLDLLADAVEHDDWSFAARALGAGHVARARTKGDEKLFVPVDASRRKLSERVVALLAVDYFVRPTDYARAIRFCDDCRADLAFRERGLHQLSAHAACACAHRDRVWIDDAPGERTRAPASGIVVRSPYATARRTGGG